MLPITSRNATELQFQALLANPDNASDNAQDDLVLDDMDDYLFLHCRKFLSEILQSKV